jgi:hypothetical protein
MWVEAIVIKILSADELLENKRYFMTYIGIIYTEERMCSEVAGSIKFHRALI